MDKYRRIMNVNVASNNKGFWRNNHSVATYEQIKKSLSYFYPKQIVEADGTHNQPPNLLDIHSFFIL